MARLIEAGLLDRPNVVGKEMPVSAIQIPKPKSRLISRDQLGSIEVDATEMKERKGIVPEGVATVFENGIAALVKIPISHVVAPIANDLEVRKESRHEDDPLPAPENRQIVCGRRRPIGKRLSHLTCRISPIVHYFYPHSAAAASPIG